LGLRRLQHLADTFFNGLGQSSVARLIEMFTVDRAVGGYRFEVE
jgi:hypothetical protein